MTYMIVLLNLQQDYEKISGEQCYFSKHLLVFAMPPAAPTLIVEAISRRAKGKCPHRLIKVSKTMYKLSFYVPESHLEAIKNALFAKGAGHYNAYDQCCWQVRGEGQFRPLAASQPYSGKKRQLKKVAEYKVEMICIDAAIKEVVQTLLSVHPYEEPAYEIYKILTVEDL